MDEAGVKGGWFQQEFVEIFGRSWSVVPAAITVATLNVFLFAFDRPWTASDGLRNWGDGLFHLLGIAPRPDILSPLLYSGSILNLGLLLGALTASLLGREFAIRVAPSGELVKGGIGGLLMGCGSVLAFGCNIGGFFSAVSALSMSGLAMMVGLTVGAYLGLRYLIWESRRWPSLVAGRSYSFCHARSTGLGYQPLLGALFLVTVLSLPFLYNSLGYSEQAAFLLFGVAFGILLQRSRFCLVRAFREPFMTGESEHTRAAAVALVVGIVGFSILKFTDLKDAKDWVFPAFWLGGFVGGVLFGVGMVLAGGCGAGSIWRAGEGHVKLWVAVALFAIGASLTRLISVQSGLLQNVGTPIFLPDVAGWGTAMTVLVAVSFGWYLFAVWNERTGKLNLI